MAKSKAIVDLEKAIEGGKDAPAPVHAIIGGEEQEPLIPADLLVQPIEGGAVARFAATMNTDLKKWQLYLYWLLLVASVMALINHIFPQPYLP